MIGKRFGKFEITGRLGEGGMGVVFEARDVELDRKVALKMLPAETANDAHRLERFRREARAVASLNHPNIVTIYGIESAGDGHVLVMECIDGESLDKRIPAGGMPQSEIFDIAIPVAEALAVAHAGGVVHRDVKPANVMITRDGLVKVLDFGLAKVAVPDDSGEGSATEIDTRTGALTGEGVVVGTAPYMSPEQLQGGNVDERSDVFSLGVMLYEMTTGKKPFDGRSGIEVASSILKDIPAPASDVRADLPRHLGRIIEHCLQKNPDDRVQTVRDVRNQLASLKRETDSGASQPSAPVAAPTPSTNRIWILGAVAVLILGLGGFSLWRAIGPRSEETVAAPVSAGEIKIVVLPFENLGAPDDEYFTDGMTDEITSRLAAINGLAVISRRSAMQFKGTRPSLEALAEEFGVAYVLEGTVHWASQSGGESRVKIIPSLVRVSDDVGVWSETFDAVLADIFEVQSEIANQVSGRLGVALLASAENASRLTENLEAYDAYLRGNDYYNRGAELNSKDDYTIAAQMFEQAVRLDPTFAEAHARLSLTQSVLHNIFVQLGENDADRLVAARTAAARALALDPDLALAHHARGDLYMIDEKDPERALEEYRSALESQPSNSAVYESISVAQQHVGQWDEALASMRKAMELNPRLGHLPCETGGVCISLRRYDEAMQLHERAIELTPNRACPYFCQVLILLHRDGNTKEAREILAKLPPSVDLEEIPPINYAWVKLDICDGKYEDALKRMASAPGDIYEAGTFPIPKAMIAAQIQELLGRPELARSHYESARELLDAGTRTHPDNSGVHGRLGVVYAGLGRKDDAIREGKLALELLDGSQGADLGDRLRDLAEIYLRVGDTEQAIDYLERLLSIPAAYSAAYLAIDPTWRALHDNPRFVALLEQHGA
jgi:serine/threonine protein kinase/tetratricopeptide (TPR) repeat protein